MSSNQSIVSRINYRARYIRIAVADRTVETTTDIVAKTKDGVMTITNKVANSNLVDIVRDKKINHLTNKLMQCETLEDEMPIRRELIKLYNK